MKHEDVALAFVAGKPAKNARMSTDGTSIIADGRCLAVKTDDGLVVVATYRSRSGSIMRAAIQRAAYQAPRYATVRVVNGVFPSTPEELRRLWEDWNEERRRLGLEPLTFGGRGAR
jgi:hypothetical protein